MAEKIGGLAMRENLLIGFIGGGAMAEAIISGVTKVGLLQSKQIFVADHKQERCAELTQKYQVQANVDAKIFVNKVDILILAIKPQVAQIAMQEVCKDVSDTAAIVSIVAGLTTSALAEYFPIQPLIRVMPNTPVAVGEGMTAIATGEKTNDLITDIVLAIFNSVGKAVILPEKMLDAVTGLSGSGPGYAFVMIDALADAGVNAGLPRQTAITLAAQTLLGAAKMVLDTGNHPAVLRDQVTSPAGTTIAGIKVMEERGVRAALLAAVETATEKSKAMGKK